MLKPATVPTTPFVAEIVLRSGGVVRCRREPIPKPSGWSSVQSLQGIKHWANLFWIAVTTHAGENPVYADKMGIEESVMNLGRRDTVRYFRYRQGKVCARDTFHVTPLATWDSRTSTVR